MRLACLLAALLTLGCAHSPAPPPGPRPLGGDANLMRGDATLAVRLRYEVASARSIVLLIELAGSGSGSVGAVEVELAPDGFALDGPATWTGEVAAGRREDLRFPLTLTAGKLGRVTVTQGIVGAPANDPVVLRFVIEDDEIRACQASEEACQDSPAAS